MQSTTPVPLPRADNLALTKALETDAHLEQLQTELGGSSPLASTLKMLRQNLAAAAEYLKDTNHTLAFIGSIGVGKTTAISHLLGLVSEDGKPALAVGNGRVTLCEVVVRQQAKAGITITPLSESDVTGHLRDFIDMLDPDPTDKIADGEPEMVSAEVARWLRNQIGLGQRYEKDPTTGNRRSIDAAKERLSLTGDKRKFQTELLAKLAYGSRTNCEFSSPDGGDLKWLRTTFEDINHGKIADAPMPATVVVGLEREPIPGTGLNIRVIDTKGIDETVEREDLHRQLRCPRTVSIICTRFNDAPEANARALFRQMKELGFEDQIAEKCVLLVLERKDESTGVTGLDGTVSDSEEGRNVRFGQIDESLRATLKLSSDQQIPEVLFFDCKNEDRTAMAHRLGAPVEALRAKRRDTIDEVGQALENIRTDRDRAVTNAALETVAAAVRAWISESRNAHGTFGGFYGSLVSDINAKGSNASSIRASMNRSGAWSNFDVYYRLAAAAQKRAVTSFQMVINELRSVLSNQSRQPGLQPAVPFIGQLQSEAERWMLHIYETANRLGREIYEAVLKNDQVFWSQQREEWGQGIGYKGRIARHTENWFGNVGAAQHERIIETEVMKAWSRFTDEIESHLLRKAAGG